MHTRNIFLAHSRSEAAGFSFNGAIVFTNNFYSRFIKKLFIYDKRNYYSRFHDGHYNRLCLKANTSSLVP